MPRVRKIALRRRERDPLADLLGDAIGAERVLTFFRQCLTHGKGEFAGQPFEPLSFQESIIRDLFDSLDESGRRRYREALLMLPRKNGKTTLSAGIALYMTFCGEHGGQVVVAATSRDQASLLFSTACDAVEASPILRARAVVSRAQKKIVDRITRTTFRAISADAPTAHGLDLTAWIYDELHAAPNGELLDVLRTSTGARREPLGIVISTAGYDLESPLGRLYQHAKRVQVDSSIDPSFYARIYEAAESDDWLDEATWHRANPALGVFRSLDEMRAAAQRAKELPAQADAFRRLYLNQWAQAESTWLNMTKWDACGDNVSDGELYGLPCYGGLDLSATTDLSAFVLLIPYEGRVYVRHWAWVPGEGIVERERRDRVPYRQWSKEGRIEIVDGAVIDPRAVVRRIIELSQRWNIQRIHFDRWGMVGVVQDLEASGLTIGQMGQGYASMSSPTKELEACILSQRLAHGGCPLLRWQASCASISTDPAGNVKLVKPDRLKHTKRIDSIVALAMAMDGLMRVHGAAGAMDAFLDEPLVL
jgi:phage terminase large subunit-like protein